MSITFLITKLQVDMRLAEEVLNLKFGLILVVKCYDCLVLVELFVIDFVRESLFHRKTLCSSNMKSTAKSQLYYVFAIACLLKFLTNLLPNTVHKEGGWLLFDLDPGFPAFKHCHKMSR